MVNNNNDVVKVRLLIETIKCEDGSISSYSVTSMDEYGAVCRKRNSNREQAIKKCKEDTENMLEGKCEYIIEEM